MGPPEFLLSDNRAVFRSIEVRRLLEAWDIAADFSCVYRSQSNSIIERVHRTIKRMVARSGRCAEQMTFWYNATAGECIASPFEMVFAAKPKMPGVTGERWGVDRDWPEPQAREKNDTRANLDKNPFVVGDEVYLNDTDGADDVAEIGHPKERGPEKLDATSPSGWRTST